MRDSIRQVLIAIALAIGVSAPCAAQEATDADQQAAESFRQSMKAALDRIWVPRSRYTNSPHVRSAFRSIVSEVREATVEVRVGRRRIAYGAIVGPDGWIVTKASLVRGAVTCRLKDGRELDARLVGVDPTTDLAMLKIDAKGLATIDLAEANKLEQVALKAGQPTDPEPAPELRPGDWLATVGLGRDPIAVGVVSVMPRPINKRRGFLGIAMNLEYTPAEGAIPGVQVSGVTGDSAASEAGVQPGDLIITIDSHPTADSQALRKRIADRNPGDRVELEVLREGTRLKLLAILRGWAPNPAQRRAYYQNNLGGDLSERRFGFPSALQHDTVLEADDCGGPIVDLEGRVVGLNISRAGRTETYALPAEIVQQRLFELMSGRLAPVDGVD